MKAFLHGVLFGYLVLLYGVPVRAATPILDALKAQNLMGDVCVAFEFEGTYEPTYAAPGFPLAPDTGWENPTATNLPGKPAFVTGHSGRGLLVEEGTTNLLTASTSGQAENLADFTALHGAVPALDTAAPLTGARCLKVTTPGKVAGEGFSIKLTGKAGQALAGSLSLRGSGQLCLRMFDLTNYLPGPPRYVTLTPEWTRYALPPVKLETADSVDVRLMVTTAGATATTFWADALQVEPREYVTSWIPGGTTREDAKMLYPLEDDAWKLEAGTVLLWAQPCWDEWMTLPPGNREFFATVYGEPCLQWNVYNTLNTMPFNGYPRVNGGNLFAGGWHFFAVSWNAGGVILCHNAQCDTGKLGAAIAKAPAFRLGPTGNAVLDQWVVLKRALTKEEMQAVYTATK